jgi:hypothetical protein
MALTTREKAIKITVTACALTSDAVHITSFDPFTFDPEDLLAHSFDDIRIDDDTRIAVFLKAVAQNSPVAIRPRILGQAVDSSKAVRIFVNFLQALLAKLAMGA